MRAGPTAALLAAVLTLAGCAERSPLADADPDQSSGRGGDGRATLVVDDAWIRPTPPVSNVGAFYLSIRNEGDDADRVIGAASPRCDEVEIHRTETVDGVASMGRAEPSDLEVTAGGSLVFEPSGLHLMCLGLDEPVVDGERLSLTVELDRAGALAVTAVAENR